MDGIDRKKDRSIYTKRACILGLAKLKNSQSTEVLIDYLSDHDSILQTFALIALISIGDSITDNLINNYNESNKVLSENIIIILANFKNEKAKIFIEKIKEEQKFLTAFEKINNLSLDDIDIERMFK
jgi:HEAT repeat protein